MTQRTGYAPLILYSPASSNANPTSYGLDYTDDAGPSLALHGWGILDPRVDGVRSWRPGGDNAAWAAGASGSAPGPYGWFGIDTIQHVNAAPSTLSLVSIAASQAVVAGTAMTLVSSTALGITVGQSITRADNGVADTGLLVIDGAPATKSYGNDTITRVYDPTTNVARNIQVRSLGDDSSATFTVRGYDIYDYPMTETITGSSGAPGTAQGVKAFKYIKSVTPAGTLSGSNVSIGHGDVYGFAVRSGTKSVATADHFESIIIYWSSTLISANTGYIAADAATPTATTGDVRGTYAVQSASNGTKTLIVWSRIDPLLLNQVGLVGQTQFSDF